MDLYTYVKGENNMYKYPITIELLSETILGNGQSKNGIVNTDVLLDEEGFPYYLGKSFKGCLKNQWILF